MVSDNGGRPNTGIGRATKKMKRQSKSSQEADDPIVDGDNDYNNVLIGGPWVVYGNYLTVRPWSLDFSSTNADMSVQVVWIRLLGLIEGFYSKVLLRAIGQIIGSVIKLNINTNLARRGHFTRLAVCVDLQKLLISKVRINGDRMEKTMVKGANEIRKMGPNGKGKGEHRPKVGLKILKPINSNGETPGLNQKKFDNGSSIARDKVEKISNHLNAKNHQAIQFGGTQQSVVLSGKELMGMMVGKEKGLFYFGTGFVGEKLEEVLKHEELLWFQNSRMKWLNCGVRNTSFFHKCTLARKKRNKIDGIKIGNEWVFDGEELKKHAMEFFKDLYSINYSVRGVLPFHGAFPKITSVNKDGLLLTVSTIHMVVFGMSPLKSSSIDGFHAKF
ncbi:hypothetical protein GOBAR_AA36490 [Gossypium barbadense]|uniref:Uncharacterized protein n=1 Tax=Gossypium barbadense TaxID=3634 RepID=A0A2P5VZF9_GOSBA|nr:hypothetical protein GOBAR_AA36490 [Gossypium barbadense]